MVVNVRCFTAVVFPFNVFCSDEHQGRAINILQPAFPKDHGSVFDLESLYAYLLKIKEPQKAKGKRYTLKSLLIIMLFAKWAGKIDPVG